jgi:hypothetical protein
MYICYVDESGHCGNKLNPVQPVEVVCGVLTDVTKLFKTQREHSALLADLGLTELKSAQAYRGRKEWSKVPAADRVALFERVIGWADDRNAKFVPAPIDSARFFERKSSGCTVSSACAAPYEAGCLNVLLAIQRAHKTKMSNKGKTIVIYDEQSGHDENFLRLVAGDLEFTDGYTGYTIPKRKTPPPRIDQIVDVPHFSKSHLAVLIQVADLAAFIINRYLLLTVYGQAEDYVGELTRVEGWYKEIGENRVSHTATDPPGSDPVCRYFREDIRPNGWTAKKWAV